jgi:hypothetical protein
LIVMLGRISNERGAALLITLLTVLLVGAVAAVLIAVSISETTIAGAHRHAAEAAYAAEAGLERALRDLDVLPDWSVVLLPPPANVLATFADGQQFPIAPDGRELDVAALLAARQATSNTQYPPSMFGANTPQWRLYGSSALAALVPSGTPVQPAYVLIWVADDAEDNDGDASVDGNQKLLVFADAYASGGARRSIAAVIARASNGALQVVAWQRD